MQSSLTCQFEHSGKVRSGLIGNFYFHCYQARPHFLCAALMSSQRTKQHAVRRLSSLLLWGWLYWFCVCIMQHPGSFKTMGSTAVVCEENVIRKTEKKERKKREIL